MEKYYLAEFPQKEIFTYIADIIINSSASLTIKNFRLWTIKL